MKIPETDTVRINEFLAMLHELLLLKYIKWYHLSACRSIVPKKQPLLQPEIDFCFSIQDMYLYVLLAIIKLQNLNYYGIPHIWNFVI